MNFARSLRVIFLLVLVVAFAVAGVLLQTGLVLQGTVLSQRFLEQSFIKTDLGTDIAGLADDMLATLDRLAAEEQDSEAQDLVRSSRKALQQNMHWIELEAPRLLSGLYGYFVAGSERGPVIDIRPVKEACVDLLAAQVAAHAGSLKQLDKMISEARSALRENPDSPAVKEAVISRIMQFGQFQSLALDRAGAASIADQIATSKELNAEQLVKQLATETVKERIGYSEIKDELDLDLLFATVYGQEDNPVTGVAGLIHDVKRAALSTVAITFVALLLVIVVTAWDARSILRWSGAGMLLSGALGVALYWFGGLADRTVVTVFKGLSEQSRGIDMTAVQGWVAAYVRGVWSTILARATTFAIIGAVLCVASFFVAGLLERIIGDARMQTAIRKCQENSGLLLTGRVALIVLLLAAIPLTALTNTRRVRASIERYEAVVESSATAAMSVDRAVGIVLNADELVEAMKEAQSGSR